ncbi:DUF2130 domain-containing protein [soil metagenome]
MSQGSQIVCPKCTHSFELSSAVSQGLEAEVAKKYAAEYAKKEKALEQREKEAATGKADLEKARMEMEEKVSAALRDGRAKMEARISETMKKAAEEDVAAKLKMLSDENTATKTKLRAAEENELLLRKQRQELEEQKKSFELQKQREMDEERARIQEKVRKDVSEELRLKMSEKDKIIADQTRVVEEMQRKLEQGSQQMQGEIQELDLEARLKSAFPFDSIEPVPKGAFGGDTIQRVRGANGVLVGTILWESKRTKAWSGGWLEKLRKDQRESKSDVAVLMSHAMPDGIDTFDFLDGVYVTCSACVVPVATVLREGLASLHGIRQATEGQKTKTEMIYQYLIGPDFRRRIEAIVETWQIMKSDLEKEKRVISAQWKKREAQIEIVLANTTSLYGELQGIAGKSLPEIESMSFPALEAAP